MRLKKRRLRLFPYQAEALAYRNKAAQAAACGECGRKQTEKEMRFYATICDRRFYQPSILRQPRRRLLDRPYFTRTADVANCN